MRYSLEWCASRGVAGVGGERGTASLFMVNWRSEAE